MAHAAVVYLRQLLDEEFMQFLCRNLEFEESKVIDFHLKVNDFLDKLNILKDFPPTLLADIQENTTFDVDFMDEDYLLGKVLLNDRNILNRIPFVMHQIDEVNSSLEDIVSSGHFSAILAQPSCRVVVDKLIYLNKEYQKFVSILGAVSEEAISLYAMLGTLMLKVKDFNDHPAVNEILEYAADEIEDFLTSYPFSMWKIDIEALIQVKNVIGNMREIIDKFDSSRSEDLPLHGESLSKPEKRPQGWLHKWKHLFCIRARCEDDDTSLKDSQLSSFPRTTSLKIQVPEIQKDPGQLPDMLFQIEGSSKSSVKREEIMIGLDDDITKIVDELTRPPSGLSIVTIAGMGGTGKTTLARKLFGHPSVVYHFHVRAWVGSISNPDRALSHLLHSIKMTSDEIQEKSSDEDCELFHGEIHGQGSEDKGETLWKSLRKRKYLIVMDNLWDFDAWKAIERYFPDDKVGSRILVTSRSMEFPTNIPRIPPHCMRLLNEKQSWEMLGKLVFGEGICPDELTPIGWVISRNCGGLRLAIVVIAGTLLNIPRSSISWRSVMDGVESIVSDNAEQSLDILSFSYNCLPHHLKTCFLFMGSFPANCEIDAQKLFNLWVAEGFSTSEKVAEEYLEDLICRCLVLAGQMSFDGKVKTCYMHELLQQLCRQKAYEEGFKRRHHISNSIIAADYSWHSLSHPRSFILLSADIDVSLDELLFQLSRYKWLRVLDMYFVPLDTFPAEILDLVNLRYLALNVTYVVDAWISRFWKLQTLVIYGPWIPKVEQQCGYLPTLFLDCWKMPWLRNVTVMVPSCFRHTPLPQRLQDGYPVPSNLESLSTITFSSCKAEVFFLMPKLKKLGVYETKEDYENGEYETCFENLPSLTELEILKCSFYKANENATRSLPLDVLPANLKKLTLCGSRLSWDKMELLASLPKLETLKLKDYAFCGEVWKLTEVVFVFLKQLLIEKTDLASWEADEGTNHFPRLERIVLRSCRSLLEIPFQAFPSLELIDVHDCCQSAESSAKEFQEQYESIKVIATDKKTVVEKGGRSIAYELKKN